MKVELPEKFGELFTPARYKAFYGGRGSAKSHSFATALLILGGQKPLRVLCGREIQVSIKDSVKQLLDDKIQALGMEEFYESLQHEIRGKNGTVFIFAGIGKMTVDQLKSYEGIDIFWGEESQNFSSHSMEILIPTIRKPGSELWFSWNPRNANDPVDYRFRGPDVPPKSIVHEVSYRDNKWFSAELEAERQYDLKVNADRYSHIWDGSYEPSAVGAIWDRQTIAAGRVTEYPALDRIIVGTDPAISNDKGSDEYGIVVVGQVGQQGYVLEDLSGNATPHQWATRVVAMYDKYEADAVAVEVNQGGDHVEQTLRAVRPDLRIVKVHVTRRKPDRAKPISALYTLGRVHHVGTFDKLEDQMCLMTSIDYEGEGSPDRLDAMVLGMSELFPALQRPKAVVVEYEPLGAGGWMG